MNEQLVTVERRQDDTIAVVTLNRPSAMNALSRTMCDAIVDVFTALQADARIRVAVLTGAGRAFCAGVDLKEAASVGDVEAGMRIINAVAAFDRPLIGAINGFAVTGGLELALACDFRIAGQSAKFADTHARVGLMPTWGMTQKLPRIIGIGRAKQMSFTGSFISAERAEQWGLVNVLVADEEVLSAALSIAEDIASCSPDMLRELKSAIDFGWERSLTEGLQEEARRGFKHNAGVSSDRMRAGLSHVQSRARRKH